MSKFVSIVIPAFNEEEFISLCLESLSNLDYPKDLLEIIVVDNGSTDNTLQLANQFPVKVVSKTDCKVGAVRNHGAQICQGEVIAFLDGDCVVEKDWLKKGLAILERGEKVVAGGMCNLPDNPTWVEKYWILNNTDNISQTRLVGANLIIPKAIFLEMNGFSEILSSNEDSDLSLRLEDSGYQVVLDSSINVVHLGYPRDLVTFTKRQLWHFESALQQFPKILLDKTFLIVCVFLFSLLAFLISLAVSDSTDLRIFLLVVFVLAPGVFTVKRVIRFRPSGLNLKSLVLMYVLDFFYFVGRAIGIVKSGFNVLRDRFN